MKTLAALFLSLLLVHGLIPHALAKNPPKHWLSSVTVADLDFQEATLREATETLTMLVRRADADHKSPNFVLAVAPVVEERRITLKRGKTDALKAIQEIVALAGCEMQLEPSAAVIREKGAPPLPAIRAAKGGEKNLARLRKIILPKIEFKEATIREAIEFVHGKCKVFEPDDRGGVGLPLRLNPTDETPPSPEPSPVSAIPAEPANPVPDAPANLAPPSSSTRVSLALVNVPLPEVCRYLCGIAGLECSVGPKGLIVAPPPARRLASGAIAKLELQEATLREAIEVLAALVIKAAPTNKNPNFILAVPPAVAERHITVKRQAGDALLTIRTVAALAGCEVQPERFGTVIREKGANPLPPVRVTKGMEWLAKKLERIVFPKMEFHDATLRECFDFISAKSRSVDPEGEGVSTVLNLDEGGSAPGAVLPNPERPGEPAPAPAPSISPGPHITLSATDMPLLELCRYAAGQAGLEASLERDSVSIVRAGAAAEPIKSLRPTPKKAGTKKSR